MKIFITNLYGRVGNVIQDPSVVSAKTGTALINNIRQGVWTERYRQGGEFKFVFDDYDLLKSFEIGTLVSHQDSRELMMVENQEIDEKRGEPPTITVSGRSLEQIVMENRIVTHRFIGGDPGGVYPNGWVAIPGAGYFANDVQSDSDLAKAIMEAYLVDGVESTKEPIQGLSIQQSYGETVDPDDRVDYAWKDLPTVYSVVMDLLASSDVGIRTQRSKSGTAGPKFIIYKGRQFSALPQDVIFSWAKGDISSARYFRSNKSEINALIINDGDITAKYYQDNGDPTGLSTRVGALDVSSLDLEWTDPSYPVSQREENSKKMKSKGRSFLRTTNPTEIFDVDISTEAKPKYGIDYIMGDIVKVVGRYKTSAYMRVIEHTISFDDKGETDFPTLSRPW